MDAKEFFNRCLNQATGVVNQVARSDLSNPTPDTDWDVERLLNHMLYELSWIPEMVSGRTIEEVGAAKYNSDFASGDFITSWSEAAKLASDAVNISDLSATAHLSFADVTNENYIRQVAGELLIHGWDLSKGINQPLIFDPEIAQELYRQVKPKAETMHSSGLFKPIVSTTENDSIQTKLLALYGRNNH